MLINRSIHVEIATPERRLPEVLLGSLLSGRLAARLEKEQGGDDQRADKRDEDAGLQRPQFSETDRSSHRELPDQQGIQTAEAGPPTERPGAFEGCSRRSNILSPGPEAPIFGGGWPGVNISGGRTPRM